MSRIGRGVLSKFLPPVVVEAFRAFRRNRAKRPRHEKCPEPGCQELQVYWDEKFADDVSQWGRRTAWDEVLFLMAARRGRVLDIACGTGINIVALSRDPMLEVHGCDISDLLIARAVSHGVVSERLTVCNAVGMPYGDGAFDIGYSIGSLEHFDVASLEACVRECRRVIRGPVFHMVPVSRSGRDEGWTQRQQSFHNNAVPWWLARFAAGYPSVQVLDSRWEDDISVGKWFVCTWRE